MKKRTSNKLVVLIILAGVALISGAPQPAAAAYHHRQPPADPAYQIPMYSASQSDFATLMRRGDVPPDVLIRAWVLFSRYGYSWDDAWRAAIGGR